MTAELRAAREADVQEIQAIYAQHVLNGTGTFDEIPPSVEQMTEHFRHVTGRGWGWIVAADATGVLGYAYCAPFRDRSAYRFTAETSVYVRDDARGRGVGKALLGKLVEAAAAAGFRRMVAVIGDSGNAGSIGVHAALGFTPAGTLRQAGLKFGRWLDVVFMERTIG